jgi:hypothetical protein
VLEALQQVGVLLRAKKCEFFTQMTTYIGLIISPEGISMDPKKTKAIKEWQSPKCIKDVQAFLVFANFYRRFIQGFSALAFPLSALTKKDTIHMVRKSRERLLGPKTGIHNGPNPTSLRPRKTHLS